MYMYAYIYVCACNAEGTLIFKSNNEIFFETVLWICKKFSFKSRTKYFVILLSILLLYMLSKNLCLIDFPCLIVIYKLINYCTIFTNIN